MGLWDKLLGEFVDVIEWTDDSNDTLVYRFERYGNEIKYGAKLTVRESQAAVFINEGQLADVFEPGMYNLETNNLPLLSTMQSWQHGAESPFKSEVYFCNLRRFTDLKWGTRNPIMLRDADYGAVRLRAFGTYAMRISEPEIFLREIVGTDGHFTTDEISNQLRNLIMSRFSNVLGRSRIPILDLAANYDQLSEFVLEQIAPEIAEYGLELTRFLVENISLPPEVEEALDKRTSMGIVSNLKDYMMYQSGTAMQDAAKNPGGGAADGIGMGMGFAMAQQMTENMSSKGTGSPPPVPLHAFYVAVGQQQTGPFTIPELQQKAATGALATTTLVWADGMADWRPAGEAAALQGVFKSTPPPIPSQPIPKV